MNSTVPNWPITESETPMPRKFVQKTLAAVVIAIAARLSGASSAARKLAGGVR